MNMVWNRLIKFICFGFLFFLVLFTLFPTLVTPHSFSTQNESALLALPNHQYRLGTDELGRDLLARILFGARLSLGCALGATLLSLLLGILFGGLSGYCGGFIDQVIMRFIDLIYSIPDLLLYILLGLFLGNHFWGLVFTLSSVAWINVARIVRGEILKNKNLPFLESAHAMGFGPARIISRHLLPQTYGPLSIALLFKIPSVIMAESTLSFLGLGIAPPYASWGVLVSEGYGALRFYPHLVLTPCLIIFLTVLCLQVLGKGVSEKS